MGVMLDDTDVVVIGAGASGLAAIKQLTTTTELKVACFESRGGPAGVWNPDIKKGRDSMIGFDRFGRPFVEPPPINSSPIYDGLRTNVPKQLMAYHDRPFLSNDPQSDFPPGHEVSKYLLEAAQELEPFIQYNCQVQSVKHHHPTSSGKNRRWIVEVVSLSSSSLTQNDRQESKTISCDFVLAASGHYSVPYVPFIPSLWTWPKEMIHSCVYINPSDAIFHRKTIAVIGIGPSGYDIIRELAMLREKEQEGQSEASKKLYSVASHPAQMGWDFNDPEAPSWTKLITTVPRFEMIEGDKIRLADGRILADIDVLCFATGYLYAFPFCKPTDSPWATHPLVHPPPIPTDHSHNLELPTSTHHDTCNGLQGGLRVHHLDSTQLFFYPDPSFAFLVLNSQVIPFPLAEYQARAIAARWSRRKEFSIIPMEDEETESKVVHALPSPREFEYENQLLERIGEGGELDTQTHWGSIPAWKYLARKETPAKRRLELGY
ncbi:hypothetical protein KEM48_000383 [Puccinia striiformis f. sp. tritici PST-130]|uniref:FAD/NAD(P)-binding domain-containing protein n=1 Tax=Puccinia striiformis f. sp. tritici PST-78 TaxID=1165861 RepID=A0A0L0VPU8_9BASI|nr:hypothetical protein Pst134EB_001656 [Puccinia striiformis f. sp. tritici]KAI9603623.1 hypothetical protein KEM48_000383 [Puccinia striiformis f. sp. tritici PST-130]KNF01010.1 hypothetical protein PSTG_05644 [Puccinia striiformis f. sp. tritici PST-78]